MGDSDTTALNFYFVTSIDKQAMIDSNTALDCCCLLLLLCCCVVAVPLLFLLLLF